MVPVEASRSEATTLRIAGPLLSLGSTSPGPTIVLTHASARSLVMATSRRVALPSIAGRRLAAPSTSL
jgi:hypothetical protein